MSVRPFTFDVKICYTTEMLRIVHIALTDDLMSSRPILSNLNWTKQHGRTGSAVQFSRPISL